MADIKVIPVAKSLSDEVIQRAVRDLLKYVRENRVYQLAFITIADDPDDPDGFKGLMDIIDSGEYDLENMIDMSEALGDMLIDIEDEILDDDE